MEGTLGSGMHTRRESEWDWGWTSIQKTKRDTTGATQATHTAEDSWFETVSGNIYTAAVRIEFDNSFRVHESMKKGQDTLRLAPAHSLRGVSLLFLFSKTTKLIIKYWPSQAAGKDKRYTYCEYQAILIDKGVFKKVESWKFEKGVEEVNNTLGEWSKQCPTHEKRMRYNKTAPTLCRQNASVQQTI